MQKKGCYLDYDRKVSVNRTLKLEKGENESRLKHLNQRENTVQPIQPIVQVSPEPKAIDQDNGFTM